MKNYKVKNKNLDKMLEYGFVYVLDNDIEMILRHEKGNVFIEPNGEIITFHPYLLEEALKNGDVIEVRKYE